MEAKDETKDRYSILSKASYDYYHNGIESANKELQSYSQTKGYSLVPSLSNKNAVVAKRDNDVVISYRGTVLTNPSDLLADTEILLGRDKIKISLNDRFDEADKLYQKVRQEYPESNIILTGHSLGSAEAIYVGTKNKTPSVSFNEGTSPLDALFSRLTPDPNQVVYITAKDIISNLTILEPYTVRFVTAKNDLNFFSHSLNYFLPEKSKSEALPTYLQPVKKTSTKPPRLAENDDYAILYFKDLVKKRNYKQRVQFDNQPRLGLFA